ncbi:MAG: phosphotransferase, partial [Alphaproteobacteria bacterium]|nr:phosphotransferase [Alphaproteobacteria bacterium]
MIDQQKLGPYLEQHIDGFAGPLTLKKFTGGQSNPTFLITAKSGNYVLRAKPPGKLLKSAHAVDREYRVTKALENTAVPVAAPRHLCCDPDIIGSWFYVMDYKEGRIFWDPALPEVDMSERTAIYHEMNRVLAAIHSVDFAAQGLSDYGRPGNYFARQISRWTKQYKASETEHIAPMEQLIDWVSNNMPPDDGRVSLIHGDYRLDNFIFHPNKPEIIAVVDWELSTLGHPLADLAYQAMQWRMPHSSLVRGLDGVDRPALGIPGEEEYIREYAGRMGRGAIDHWPFYLAFSFFRLAAIVQGVM